MRTCSLQNLKVKSIKSVIYIFFSILMKVNSRSCIELSYHNGYQNAWILLNILTYHDNYFSHLAIITIPPSPSFTPFLLYPIIFSDQEDHTNQYLWTHSYKHTQTQEQKLFYTQGHTTSITHTHTHAYIHSGIHHTHTHTHTCLFALRDTPHQYTHTCLYKVGRSHLVL